MTCKRIHQTYAVHSLDLDDMWIHQIQIDPDRFVSCAMYSTGCTTPPITRAATRTAGVGVWLPSACCVPREPPLVYHVSPHKRYKAAPH